MNIEILPYSSSRGGRATTCSMTKYIPLFFGLKEARRVFFHSRVRLKHKEMEWKEARIVSVKVPFELIPRSLLSHHNLILPNAI